MFCVTILIYTLLFSHKKTLNFGNFYSHRSSNSHWNLNPIPLWNRNFSGSGISMCINLDSTLTEIWNWSTNQLRFETFRDFKCSSRRICQLSFEISKIMVLVSTPIWKIFILKSILLISPSLHFNSNIAEFLKSVYLSILIWNIPLSKSPYIHQYHFFHWEISNLGIFILIILQPLSLRESPKSNILLYWKLLNFWSFYALQFYPNHQLKSTNKTGIFVNSDLKL